MDEALTIYGLVDPSSLVRKEEEAPLLYRARVERIRDVPRTGRWGPKMVRAGREELGSFALCAQCWAHLPGAR